MSTYLTDAGRAALQELWPAQVTHVSASSLAMLGRCPEQYRQVYILGHRRRPAAAALWGKADHAAVEWALTQKRDEGTTPSATDVEERFAHEFNESIEEAGGSAEIVWDNPLKAAEERDKILRMGAGLASCYVKTVVPMVVPVKIEESFSLDVGLPVPVVGRIDLTGHYEDERSATPRLMERKTSKRRVSTPAPDWVAQAKIYQVVEPLDFDWHVSLKQVTPSVLLREGNLRMPLNPDPRQTRQWLSRMVGMVGHYYLTYGPDSEWPGTGTVHPWACNYCGFNQDCLYQRSNIYLPPRGAASEED